MMRPRVDKAFVCRRKLPPSRNACLKLGEACDEREAGPRSPKKICEGGQKIKAGTTKDLSHACDKFATGVGQAGWPLMP